MEISGTTPASTRPDASDADTTEEAGSPAPPTPPWVPIVVGLVLQAIGWGMVIDTVDAGVFRIGVAFVAVGSVLSAIGVIAAGVVLGMQRLAWAQRTDSVSPGS